MLVREHRRFLEHISRESAKLKRETKGQLKSLRGMVEQEVVYD